MTEREKNKLKDSAVHKAVKAFCSIIPDVKYSDYLNCGSENFLPGSKGFIREPAKDACWSLGFAKASVLPDDLTVGEYYIAGYLAYPPNRAEGVLDDMIFRAVALKDAESRGINVFCALDCVGLSNTDIRDIRKRLAEYTEEKNIMSLNISSTHCHSAIDTQGLWGKLSDALKKNPPASLKKNTEEWVSGKNKAFMERLKDTAAAVIKKAVESMKPGKLMYSIADASAFARDKRPPDVIIKELGVIRFEPFDSGPSTTAAILGAHATCLGEKNRMVSGDYPYYFCSEIEKNGGNAIFFQGAEAAVAANRGPFSPEGCDKIGSIAAYGAAIADYIMNISEEEYTEIEPLMNIALSEVFLPVHNSIFLLIMKMHLVNNRIVFEKRKKGLRQDEYFVITEIGYVMLGSKLRIALMPGEIMPELVCGGCADSTQAYTHLSWELPPMSEKTGGALLCIGLCNDSIGYVVPDNDFGSIFETNHYEESVSVGDNCASNLVNAFFRLVSSCEDKYINPDFIGKNQ